MNWKNLRVLVTGAGGFIGSHLAGELARRGAKVRALVHYNSRSDRGFLNDLDGELSKRVEIRPGDITDPHFVSELAAGQEVVFHLAALIGIPYSYAAPASYVAVNVSGTLNVLEACRRRGVGKLVHTSTSEVYGTALYDPIDEKHPLQGQSPYSASKIGADQLVESFHRSFGLPAAIARPFNTYGPRQSARAVLPTIVSQLLQNGKLSLGDTTPIRDFNYVQDTVEGFLSIAASKNSLGQTINLGSGRAVSVGDAAKIAMRLLGLQAPIKKEKARLRPPKSEVFKLICDNKKARRLLGWKPRYALEEGLALLIAYVNSHRHEYKTREYTV